MSQRSVAILGGGMSALATAYHLTSLADWQSRYRITVYQQGWRLGGKCASGRNVERGWRVEEHGLHVLFGWYENTFRLIRGCYEELGRGSEWPDAFLPCSTLVAPEWVDGRVDPWLVECPVNGGPLGEGPDVLASPEQYVKNLYAWVARQLRGWRLAGKGGGDTDLPATLDELREELRALAGSRGTPDPATTQRLPQLAERLVELSPDWSRPGSEDHASLVFLTDELRERMREDWWWYTLEPKDDEASTRGPMADLRTRLRRLRIFVDFCYTAGKGLLAELLVAGRTWFDLDALDLRDWLRRWGADEATIGSVIVDAIYGAVFSSGTPGHGVGAGTILQSALRAAFFFKGAAVLQPNGSIADVAFAPLYETLRRRGVRFEFFHRVEELTLSEDRTRVQAIRMARQARLADGHGEYDPLLMLDGRPVWPAQPRLEQLADGEAVAGHDLESFWDPWAVDEIELRHAEHFDLVVFGISVAALPELFPDALADPHNEPLQWMVRALATTQTQAAQLWFAPRPEAPHWPGRLPLAAPIAIPYQMPFDTVADMEHILLHERWTQPVSRLFYLCAALPDDELPPPRGDLEYPARQRARVQGNIASWLERLGAPLLRDAEGTLFEASNQSQRSWLEQQYVNAPVNPSDRYVLCTPGSAAYRLGADQSGYENLYLTGDWIRTAVSAGCLEAATMAGVQAARAIDPAVPKALGDWLPEPAPQVRSGGNDHALVYRDGDLVGQPPIAIPRLDLFVFVLRADERALQRLCAAQLELGGPTTYRPLGPFVMLYASSMTNEARPFGRCDELDIGFWIPLIASGDEHVVMYSPYVWVDNSLALASGRELFGFPKQLGTLSFAPSEGRFAVSTSVLPRRGGDVELRPLIEVRTNGAPRAAASLGSWGELAAAGARLAARLIGRHPSAMQHWMTQMVTRPSLPMLFLKQLPGASNERRAVYRALIEASIDVAPGPYSLTPLDGPVEVTLYEYESHRIARTLGLLRRAHHAGISQLRPEAQARLRFGAVVQPGIEVWRDV